MLCTIQINCLIIIYKLINTKITSNQIIETKDRAGILHVLCQSIKNRMEQTSCLCSKTQINVAWTRHGAFAPSAKHTPSCARFGVERLSLPEDRACVVTLRITMMMMITTSMSPRAIFDLMLIHLFTKYT